MAPFSLKKLERAQRWFHALADETRLKIVGRLINGEQCVCHLTEMLETGQSRLSFHLKTLKDAGLIKDRRQGRWVYYSLDPEALEELQRFISEVTICCRNLRVVSKGCA
jgi:ArsR family transcriptional regulator